MRFFSLNRDLTVSAAQYQRHYQAVTDHQSAEVDRLYLAVGQEFQQVCLSLQHEYAKEHPELDQDAIQQLSSSELGVQVIDDTALLAWAGFPISFGRLSSRFKGKGLHLHEEAEVLPAQLAALRRQKPDKHHFRFLLVNGFGANLGDSTVGCTALRHVLTCMRRFLPEVGCDLLLGAGGSSAIGALFATEPEVERVLYQGVTASELALYDGYFDFTDLILRPRYDELPAVDWALWWCGLDPETIAPEEKRNRGQVDPVVWRSVQALLSEGPACGGRRVLFNPRASAPLRSMPESVAVDFASALLSQAPELQLVIDQPLAFAHERLKDLSEHIDSPEKLKALIAQVDGVISVDTFAIHWADVCSVPTVGLCSSIDPTHYPYYPYFSGGAIEHFRHLPGYSKTKLSEAAWLACRDDYHKAWQNVCPVATLNALEASLAARSALKDKAEENSAVIGSDSVFQQPVWHQRYRISALHRWIAGRFASLSEQLLKPGMTCVLAGVPDSRLALALSEQVGDNGLLVAFEPRRLQARALEHLLYRAGNIRARVDVKLPLPEGECGRIPDTLPWFESRSEKWGNSLDMVEVPVVPVDDLALAHCASLLIQSPMVFAQVLAGAQATLRRCRPVVLMGPVARDQVSQVCCMLVSEHYTCWAQAEPASGSSLGGTGQDGALLIVAVPEENKVNVDGLQKIEVTT